MGLRDASVHARLSRARITGIGLSAALIGAAITVLPAVSPAAAATTPSTYVVPGSGTTIVKIDAIGGGGGGGHGGVASVKNAGGAGGSGAYVSGYFSLTGGETLNYVVGSPGQGGGLTGYGPSHNLAYPGGAGWAPGGDGGQYPSTTMGGGAGGSTAVVHSDGTPVVVAGGGGGGGAGTSTNGYTWSDGGNGGSGAAASTAAGGAGGDTTVIDPPAGMTAGQVTSSGGSGGSGGTGGAGGTISTAQSGTTPPNPGSDWGNGAIDTAGRGGNGGYAGGRPGAGGGGAGYGGGGAGGSTIAASYSSSSAGGGAGGSYPLSGATYQPITVGTASAGSGGLGGSTTAGATLAPNGVAGSLTFTSLTAASIDSAVAGTQQVTVNWSAPGTQTSTDGTVTYQVFANSVGQNGSGCNSTGASGSCVVTGLTGGQQYAFTIKATSAGGLATSSAVTNATPNAPPNPTVTSVSPNSGVYTGGTPVTITGTNFVNGATVTIGGAAATNVAFVNSTTLTATTPAGTVGARDVVVTDPDTTTGTLAGGFTYTAVVPTAPSITGITPGDKSLSVAFSAPGSDGGSSITTYQYSTDGGSSWQTRSSGTTTSPLVISTLSTDGSTVLTNGTSYNVQVRAVNVAGNGAATGSTAAAPGVASAPVITGITPGNASLSVAFTAPTNNGGAAITNYQFSTDNGSSWATLSPSSTTSPLSITTQSTSGTPALVNGTAYTVLIRAVNGLATGTSSNSMSGTPRTTPSAPAISSVTPGDKSLSVAFSAGSDGGNAITTYQYSTDGGSSWQTRSSGTTASPLVISTLSTNGTTALTNGTSYNVQIRAVNGAGNGAATSTTAATPGQASAPTITGITPGNVSLSVAFTAPSNNGGATITNYQFSTDNGSSWATLSPSSTASPLSITTQSTSGTPALVNGTAYTVLIRAVNGLATGVSSNSMSGTPRTTPSAPSITGITPGDKSLSVAFNVPGSDGGSAITTYQYSTDSGTSWQTRSSGTTASPLVISTLSTNGTTALANGTLYNVQIRAVNAAGNGLATSSTGATPGVASAPTITGITPGNVSLSVAFTAPSNNGGATISNYQFSTDNGSSWATLSPSSTASPLSITTQSTSGTPALVNGTAYTVLIRAVNGLATGTSSNSMSGTPRTTATAPSITGITPGDKSLSVAFTAPSSDGGDSITTYQYSTDGGSSWQTRSSGTTASPLVFSTLSTNGTTALANGTSYNVQIRAVNGAGNGTATASTAAAPGVASAPTITGVTPGNVSLSVAFTAPTNNGGATITNYQFSTDSGSSWATLSPSSTASPLSITTQSISGTPALVNGTAYTVLIRAVNGLATGTSSNAMSGTPRTTATAPTITGVTPGDKSLSVAFTAPSSDGGDSITTYQYSTDGGSSWQTRSSGTTASPLVISTLSTNGTTALTNGTSYNVQIRAVNGAGNGVATSSSPAAPGVASAPTITGVTPGNISLSVAFTAPSNNGGAAITNYQFSTDNGSSWATLSPSGTASPLSITTQSTSGTPALVNGTAYTVLIRAVNGLATGTSSNSMSGTPRTTATAPAITSITPGDKSLSVAFTAPSSDGGDAITTYQYSSDGGASWQTRASGTTASPLVVSTLSTNGTTALTNGTSYNVQIRAVNGAGNGTASASTAAAPGVASAPTIIGVTPGNVSLSVAFTAPSINGGAAITNYQFSTDNGSSWATLSPSSTASPLSITTQSTSGTPALVNGTAYTVLIRAVNGLATGTSSNAMSGTPRTTATAPSITGITPGDKSLSVAFTPPSSDGGDAITTYQYSTDGGTSWQTRAAGTTASPLVVSTLSTNGTTALANGTSYNVQIRAVNGAGNGAATGSTAATPGVASAPTITGVTPANVSLSVVFTAPTNNGGAAITNYQFSTDNGSSWATLSPSSTASPLSITTQSTSGTPALVNGTAYTVLIRAVNGLATGTSSNSMSGTPRTTATAPAITGITPGDKSLSVAFTAPGSDGGDSITTYQYSTDGGSSWQTRAAGTTASPLVVSTLSTNGTTALTNGTSYNVQIRAVNGAGNGAATASTAAAPGVASAPAITAVTPGNVQLSVSFNAPTNNGGAAISNYQFSTDNGSSWATLSPSSATSPLSITTQSTSGTPALVNGTSYNIKIRAVNGLATGTSSNSMSGTPRTTASAPAITGITPGDKSLSVAFTAPSSDGGDAITTYQYSTDGGTSWQTRGTGTTASTLLISALSTDGTTQLTNGTSYNVQIRAVNGAGNGIATGSTAGAPGQASAPVITGVTPGNTQLTVAFTAPVNNGGATISNYEFSTNGGTDWATLSPANASSPLTLTTQSTSGTPALANGTSYDIKIRAVNGLATGVQSNSMSGIPRTTASAPAVTGITPGNKTLSVAFTAPGSDGGDAITTYQYSTDGGTSWQTRGTGTTASPLLINALSTNGTTQLTNGTSYNVQIRAVNAAGNGTATGSTAGTPGQASAPAITGITPGNAQLTVAFTAPSNNGGAAISNYEFSTDNGSTWATLSPADSTSPITLTTQSASGTPALANGTTYQVKIRAVNGLATGVESGESDGIPRTVPDVPAMGAITPGDTSLSVAFTAPGWDGGNAITTYQYSTDGGTSWQTRGTGTTASPLLINALSTDGTTALTNGTSYNVQIRAVNDAGAGAATATTAGIPGKASAPVITGITPGNAQLTVALTAPVDDGGATISNYEFSTNGGTDWATLSPANASSPLTLTTQSTSGTPALANGTSYDIKIRAVNGLATGTASNLMSSIPRTVPDAPVTGAITPGDKSLSVAFTAPGWNGGNAITTYKYSTDGGSTWQTRATGTTASPLLITTESSDGTTALSNGTSYDVQLRAINDAGDGVATGTTAATPGQASAPTVTGVTPGNAQLTVASTAPVNNGGATISNYEYSTNGGTDWATLTPANATSPLILTTQSTSGTPALENGTSYNVKIRAVNGLATGVESNAISGIPRTVPDVPTTGAITPGDKSLSVAFTAPAWDGGNAITTYQYSTDGGTSWQTRATGTTASPLMIDTLSTNGTTQLSNGTSYDVQLRAVNDAGPGTATTTTTATPGQASAPAITGVTPGNAVLSVAFTAPADNGGAAITNYRFSTDGGTSWATLSPANASSPLTLTTQSTSGTPDLENGTTYDIKIRAVNGLAAGTPSNSMSGIPRTTPDAPTIGKITPGDQSLSVAFTAPVWDGGNAITTYEYSTDNGVTWQNRTSGTTASPLQITDLSTDGTTDLTNGTAYTVKIRAVNDAGSGAASDAGTGTPGQASAPTITVITPDNAQLSVAISAPTDDGGAAISNYEFSTNGGTDWALLSPANSTSPLVITTQSVSGTPALENGTSYSVRVRAVNGLATGVESNASAAIPRTVPDAASIASIANGDAELSVDFSVPTWNGGNAITTYEYSTDGGTSWQTRSTGTTATPLVIDTVSTDGATQLVNGTSYDVQIRAVNDAGSGAATASTTATPGQASAPTITAVTPGNQELSVAFSAPVTVGGHAVTTYEYSTDAGATWLQRQTGTVASPLVITTQSGDGTTLVANGTSYDVKIRALNSLATGVESNMMSGIPRTTASAPAITGIVNGDQQLTVAFTAPSSDGGNAISGYEYSTDGGSTWQPRTDAGGPGSPVLITDLSTNGTTNLTNGTSYDIQLRAVNAAGSGLASSTTAATPGEATAATITSVDHADEQLSVNFTAPSADGGHAITSYQYSTDNGASWRMRDAGSTESPLVIESASSDNTALGNGTSYNIKIRALNSLANGAASTATAAIPSTQPTVETSDASAITKSSATLNASVNAEGNTTTALTIKWSTDESEVNAGNGTSAIVTPTSATGPNPTSVSAPLTNLTPSTTYYFRVSATNADGTSNGTTRSFATTNDPTVTTDAATDVTRDTATLNATVNAMGDSVSTIVIKYSTDQSVVDAGDGTSASETPSTATGLNDTAVAAAVSGLQSGTTYYFRAKATNGNGTTTGSTQSFTTEPDLPAPTITSVTEDDVALSIAFQSGGDVGTATINDYEYSTDGGTHWASLDSTSGPFVITTQSGTARPALVNGSEYAVVLRAVNSFGPGEASNVVNATPRTVPDAPTDVSGAVQNSGIAVTWVAPADDGGAAVAGYRVQVASDANGPFTNAAGDCSPSNRLASTATSCTASGLTNGTNYWLRVAAINEAGQGNYSSVSDQVAPGTSSTVPTNVTVVASSGAVNVSWNPPTDTGGRPITSYTATADPGGQTCTTATTTCTVSGLTNGTRYRFTVVATNELATSVPSAPSEPVTPGDPARPIITSVVMGNTSATVSVIPSPDGGTTTYIDVEAILSGTRMVEVLSANPTCRITLPATSCVVSGLRKDSTYTFVATAHNGSTMTATAQVKPSGHTGKPGAPTIAKVRIVKGGITVRVQPNPVGGSPAAYKITASGSSRNCSITAPATACTVKGLRAGKSVRFRAVASNSAGKSKPSKWSAPVTPQSKVIRITGYAVKKNACTIAVQIRGTVGGKWTPVTVFKKIHGRWSWIATTNSTRSTNWAVTIPVTSKKMHIKVRDQAGTYATTTINSTKTRGC